jgi:hypothetical protein
MTRHPSIRPSSMQIPVWVELEVDDVVEVSLVI